MMSRYFTIGGYKILQANGFNPAKEAILGGEFITYDGRQCGDILGWRYSDMTLSWDMLPEKQFTDLQNLSGNVDFTFTGTSGLEETEEILITSKAQAATRFTYESGTAVYKDIQMGVRFVGSHN